MAKNSATPSGFDIEDDDDDIDDDHAQGPAKPGKTPAERSKDVARREELGRLMAKFNWAARARGIAQTEVSLMVGTDELRFNRDVNVVARRATVKPEIIAAYQAVLKLTPEYLLSPNGDEVPETRRLESSAEVNQQGLAMARVLADHAVVGNEAVRDVIENGLLMHAFRLHPGEVLDLLAIKQQRDRKNTARRIRESLKFLDRSGPEQ